MGQSSESSPTKDLSPRWVLSQSCLSPETALYHWPALPPPRVPTLGRPWVRAQSMWGQVAKAAERNCDSHLSADLRALPCRMSYSVQAVMLACSSMRFTGLNSTGSHCNPAPPPATAFYPSVRELWAWKTVCRHVRKPSPAAPCLHQACCRLGGRSRLATIPESRNLLLCPRSGHGRAKARLCLAGCLPLKNLLVHKY